MIRNTMIRNTMIRNTKTSWGWVAILLHWAGAALIFVLLAHGWWMTHLTPRGDRIANYVWHAALGYDLLALLLLRLLWRWLNPVPNLPDDLKLWERHAAKLGHFGLYLLMFATTVVGWALAGTGRQPFDHDLLGIHIPLIYVGDDRAMHGLFEDTHKILAYLLAALVIVHLIGALRHHFVKRNSILRRMIGAKA